MGSGFTALAGEGGRGVSSAEEGPPDPELTPSAILGGLALSAFQELGVE